MTWFFIALVGPLLFAATNHIDKILLEKYFKDGGVGTLMLFSSLLSVLALPIFYVLDPTILDVSWGNMSVLLVVGILNMLVLLCYFIALSEDEASIVVVFYQLVPVFGYILGYFILNESLTTLQIIAMAIVILGTTIISFEIDAENKFTLKKSTAFYMTLAALLWGLESTLFKAAALEENVIRSLFWQHVALVGVGVFILMFMKRHRQHFITVFKENSGKVIGFNFLNEALYMGGNAAVGFALVLAPVALVLLTNSFQPIFVLLIGIILTLFFPKISVEKIHAYHLYQKLIAILITGVGTYMLLMPV